jgi:hypothetical protein
VPPLSLRKLHPAEASQLAALLTRLRENSGMSQKDLAVELKISEAALSRSLSNDAVLPENALEPFLDLTKAGDDDRAQAQALMTTITSPVKAPSPPPPLSPPMSPPVVGLVSGSGTVTPPAGPPPSQVRRPPVWRRTRGRALVVIITVLGLSYCLVQFVVVPVLRGPAQAPAITCSEPTPSLPTAWSATCTAKSVFNRTKGEFTLTDLGQDGKSVFLEVKFNGGEIIRRYNSNGFGNPPKVHTFPNIDAGTKVEFQTCLANRNAKREANRRPVECGGFIADPGR